MQNLLIKPLVQFPKLNTLFCNLQVMIEGIKASCVVQKLTQRWLAAFALWPYTFI